MAGYSFTEGAARKVVQATKIVLGSHNETGRRRGPRDDVGGGGCETQNTIWDITVFGSPTGSTLTLPVEINNVEEDIVLNWNDDAADVETALEGHSEIGSGDVSVTGGPFPNATIRIELTGDLANQYFLQPTAEFALTGGSGVGVICAMAQRGHS